MIFINIDRRCETGAVFGTSNLPRQGFHIVDLEHPVDEDILDEYLAHEVEIGVATIGRFCNKLKAHGQIVQEEKAREELRKQVEASFVPVSEGVNY